MDKTEILAEAMRLAVEFAEYPTTRDTLESFLRAHLTGQAEPVASEKLSDGDLARQAESCGAHVWDWTSGGGITFSAGDWGRFCDILRASIPLAAPAPAQSESVGPQGNGWRTVLVNESFDALMAALDRADRKGYLPEVMAEEWASFEWENLPSKQAEPIAQEKTAYNMGRIAAWQEIRAAQPEQDQAQLVTALEEIASMTYDSWTNGARAGEIARVALKKAKDGQDSYRIDYGDYGSL